MELESNFEFLNNDAIRVKGTRVGIEIVIERYLEGYTPEEIAREYPALDIKQVYATITYYLFNKETLDVYINESAAIVEEAWQQQRRHPHPGVKQILDLKAQREPVK